MTNIIDNAAKTNRNFDRLDVLVNGDETTTYTNENGDTKGSLAKQVRELQTHLLADHVELEEGTWTPHFITSTGDDFYTATGVEASYSKISQFVSITAYFEAIHADIVPTGDLEIRGLPFEVYLGANAHIYWNSGILFDTGQLPFGSLNGSKISLRVLDGSSANVHLISPNDLNTGNIEKLYISGTYITT